TVLSAVFGSIFPTIFVPSNDYPSCTVRCVRSPGQVRLLIFKRTAATHSARFGGGTLQRTSRRKNCTQNVSGGPPGPSLFDSKWMVDCIDEVDSGRRRRAHGMRVPPYRACHWTFRPYLGIIHELKCPR